MAEGLPSKFLPQGYDRHQPVAVVAGQRDYPTLVVEAIRENRFFVLTHPEWQGMVRDRVDRMLSGEQPWAQLPPN